MRILLIADIHSNWPALQAIDETFDACLMLGDLVDYGTDPVPCLDWSRRFATAAIRGNHDHAVAQRIMARQGGGFRRLAAATRPLHWDVVDPQRMRYLSRLPVTYHLMLGEHRFYLVHATPRDPMDEYLTTDRDAWQARLKGIEADFVCVGHSHQPFHLELDSLQIVNPGSVGQPRDGDWRAAYVIIEDGKVEFKRVEYDIDATIQQMKECHLPEWVVALNDAILRSGGRLTREEMDAFQ